VPCKGKTQDLRADFDPPNEAGAFSSRPGWKAKPGRAACLKPVPDAVRTIELAKRPAGGNHPPAGLSKEGSSCMGHGPIRKGEHKPLEEKMSEREAVIVSACRTAVGSFGGTLKEVHAYKIAATTMREAIRRAGIPADIIDDVRYGCCMEPYDALNIARVAALEAGVSDQSTAVTINRVCISGMEAAVSGMAMIKTGLADVILAGGVEHMSGVAYGVRGARWGCRLHNQSFDDMMMEFLHCGSKLLPGPEKGPVKEGMPIDLYKGKPYLMGHTEEFVAQMYNISRESFNKS
jgi:hypothetical protein